MTYSLSSRTAQPHSDLKISLNGVEIEKVSEFKFLGIHIDEHLSWKSHMNKLLAKIFKNLGVVRKISCFLSKKNIDTDVSFNDYESY